MSPIVIKSKNYTVLKQSISQSKSLSPSEVVSLEENTSIEITDYLSIEGTNHTIINLVTPLLGHSLWAVYNKHWNLFDSISVSNKVILDVPYLTQRDNKYAPASTCNLTCVAMVLQFFNIPQKTKEPQFEDELYMLCQTKAWDRRQHSVLKEVFKEYGVKDNFVTSASWDMLRSSIRSGNPCIISAKFTRSGHIVVVTGYDSDGFYINDPWGKYIKAPYVYELSNQPNHFISIDSLRQITYSSVPETIWCHFPSLV